MSEPAVRIDAWARLTFWRSSQFPPDLMRAVYISRSRKEPLGSKCCVTNNSRTNFNSRVCRRCWCAQPIARSKKRRSCPARSLMKLFIEDPGDEIGPEADGSKNMGIWFYDLDGYRWELSVQGGCK
jgi:hypothetical protein